MITEDGLADRFERAVRDLEPAVNIIVTEAERRGRRLRTRRRAWLSLGGSVVAALTATALVAGVQLSHPRGALATAGASGRHGTSTHAGASQPSATPSVASSASTAPAGPGSGRIPSVDPSYLMPVSRMLDALRSLLPAGSTLGYVNPYSSQPGNLEVDYNDGQGSVDLQITVEPTAFFTSPMVCPVSLWQDEGPRPAGALPISCATRTLPDGSFERDAVYYADAYGFYAFSVYDQRPDGVTVDVEVGNGIIHTLPQVDRARPPGSMAEWEALAENPVWQLKDGWHLGS